MPRIYLCLLLAACGSSKEYADAGAADGAPSPDGAGGFTVDHPTELVTGRHSPDGLALDGDALFWYENAAGGGAIERMDLDTRTITELATGVGSSAQITLFDGKVYWVDRDTNEASMVAEGGGLAFLTLDEPAEGMRDLASDGARLYWVTSGHVRSAGPENSDVQTFGAWPGTEPPADVYVDADRVLWVAAGELWAADKTGGAAAKLADVGDGDVVTGGGHVFVTDRGGGPLLQLDLDGSNPTPLAQGTRSARAGFDGDTLTWTNAADPADATTGSVTTLARTIATTDQPASGIAIGGSVVFYSELAEGGGVWAAPR